MSNIATTTATATTVIPSGFTKREGGTLLDCNRQWATRSPDEAVYSVEELVTRTHAMRELSAEKGDVPWDSLRVETDGEDLVLVGRGGKGAHFTNWSFSQFCALPAADASGGLAPASFLNKLSASTAAGVLNERLSAGIGRSKEARLLVKRNGSLTLRSITTDAYTRVWDHDLALRVANLCKGGSWGPASAFKRAGGQADRIAWDSGDKRLPLGWVGDRSMFVCLVDYDGIVHSDGNTYARFFLLSNSEVGAGALKVTFGLLDFVCCNFILWGCTEVYEANLRHTKSVHDRWNEISGGFSRSLSADNRGLILEGISSARAMLVDEVPDAVIAKVQAVTDLPKTLVTNAFETARDTPRYGDPRSVWGMVNGLTEVSQLSQNADKRTDIDLKAARLMGLLRR